MDVRLCSLGALLLVGCADYDLPPGWADARRLGVAQTECAGSPYEPHDERLEATGARSAIVADLRETTFRCEQSVEAFVRERGTAIDVLVQPEEMDPSAVAACDCLYDVHVEVDEVAAGHHELSAFRRWDNLNVPNEPVAIGNAIVEVQ